MMPRSTRYGIFSMNPAYVPRRAERDPGARVGGEPRHVRLVDDGLAPRAAKGTVAFPVVAGGIEDHALHRGGAIAPIARLDPAIVLWGGDAAAIRVEQDADASNRSPSSGAHGPSTANPYSWAWAVPGTWTCQ